MERHLATGDDDVTTLAVAGTDRHYKIKPQITCLFSYNSGITKNDIQDAKKITNREPKSGLNDRGSMVSST